VEGEDLILKEPGGLLEESITWTGPTQKRGKIKKKTTKKPPAQGEWEKRDVQVCSKGKSISPR